MNAKRDAGEITDGANQPFYDKAVRALRELFEKAKATHELHFTMALMGELRGAQDGGWNTAEDASRAYDEYTTLIKSLNKDDLVRIRVILAFYAHVSEASGFYEIPKKLMLTVDGQGNNIRPFQHLVQRHQTTGNIMAPNANRIMKDLMGHASELGLKELAEVFQEAFDPDVRNAVAHADYVLARDGMRLRRRNGGQPRVIPWGEFDPLICRGINLFSFIRQIVDEYIRSYHPPKTIRSQLSEAEPVTDYTIYYDPTTRNYGWIIGKLLPDGYGQGVAQTK
jgi:hypothetical protein